MARCGVIIEPSPWLRPAGRQNATGGAAILRWVTRATVMRVFFHPTRRLLASPPTLPGPSSLFGLEADEFPIKLTHIGLACWAVVMSILLIQWRCVARAECMCQLGRDRGAVDVSCAEKLHMRMPICLGSMPIIVGVSTVELPLVNLGGNQYRSRTFSDDGGHVRDRPLG